MAHLAHLIKHAVGPVWDIDRDLCSSKLSEGLGIQNEQESTFLLETEDVKNRRSHISHSTVSKYAVTI